MTFRRADASLEDKRLPVSPMRPALLAALATLAAPVARAQVPDTLAAAPAAVGVAVDTLAAAPPTSAVEAADPLAAPSLLAWPGSASTVVASPPALPRSVVLRAEAGPQAQDPPVSQAGLVSRELGFAAAGVVGGLVGGAVFAGAGALAGAAADDGESEAVVSGAFVFGLLGAGVGYAIGVPVGIHAANRGRGSVGLGLLASGAVAVLAGATAAETGWPERGTTAIPVLLASHLILTSVATRLRL